MTARRYLHQRLRLHQLRALDAVDRHGSLLKAAATLGVGQPALSKSLRELETLLGLRVVDRHPRGVSLTPAGRAAADSARRIAAELRRLDDELDRLSQPDGGTVAIGALPVAAAGVLPGVLTRLKAAHPALRVRVQQGRTEELLPALAAGELDLVVGRLYAPPLPDGFDREALWAEPISLLARADHPLFALDRLSMDDLRRHDLVLPTVTQRVGQEIEGLLAALDLRPAAALRSSSEGFIREMLLGTDLLSAMPRLLMAGDLLRGTLRVVPLPIAAPDRPAGLILPRGRALPPAGEAFVAALRAFVVELADRGIAEAMSDGDTAAPGSDRVAAARKRYRAPERG